MDHTIMPHGDILIQMYKVLELDILSDRKYLGFR